MAKKRGLIGFKGIALAPVTKNDITGYESGTAEAVPYAGTMTLSPIEQSQDFNFDDELYAQVRNTSGLNVEIHIAEMSLEQAADLGLGVYDATKHALQYDFNPKAGEYSLRYITDSVSNLPEYFLHRVFDLQGIRQGDHTTKGDSLTMSDVIITGVLRRPTMASSFPAERRQMAEDRSNVTELDAFLVDGETLP